MLESEAIHNVTVQRWSNISGAVGSLGVHWPEYLMEACEIGLYML